MALPPITPRDQLQRLIDLGRKTWRHWWLIALFAASIGLPRAHMVVRIAYRAARAGIVTGILLAIARISGETAPLLFTALNNQFFSLNMNAPMPSLPVVIFQFALSPYEEWQKLAWTGALLITVTVLALSIIARSLTAARKSS